jgi:hypothetical protein
MCFQLLYYSVVNHFGKAPQQFVPSSAKIKGIDDKPKKSFFSRKILRQLHLSIRSYDDLRSGSEEKGFKK